jgi:hypothetical protein
MSFEHAPVSKGIAGLFHLRISSLNLWIGLMVVCGLTSMVVGIFDIKHYLHLQVFQLLNGFLSLTLPYSSFHIYQGTIKYRLNPCFTFKTQTSLSQYWRLFAHHLAFSNSSDLLVAELLLYNVAVQIERQFGSLKFAVSMIYSGRVTHEHISFKVVCFGDNLSVDCDGISFPSPPTSCWPQLYLFRPIDPRLQYLIPILPNCPIILPIPHIWGPTQ